MTDFFRKHTLIAGTLLLTATGFASRILGFFTESFYPAPSALKDWGFIR